MTILFIVAVLVVIVYHKFLHKFIETVKALAGYFTVIFLDCSLASIIVLYAR